MLLSSSLRKSLLTLGVALPLAAGAAFAQTGAPPVDPSKVVARVNGAAIGGGVGLIACCDLAIAVDSATFGFTEVKLGIVPAVIARFVVPRIGAGHARALFVGGTRFDATRAAAIGLVHQVVAAEELDSAVAAAVEELLSSGPAAVARAKALGYNVGRFEYPKHG